MFSSHLPYDYVSQMLQRSLRLAGSAQGVLSVAKDFGTEGRAN
jgi:hypothetical protein